MSIRMLYIVIKDMKLITIISSIFLISYIATGMDIYSPFGGSIQNAIYPFFIDDTESMRYQQVYRASDFYGIGIDGGNITGIGFLYGTFSMTASGLSNLEIILSTTSKTPDHLSEIFEENIGQDQTTVYGPGELLFVNAPGLDLIAITLDQPFYYNPFSGRNLLMEIKNAKGNAPSPDPPMFGSIGIYISNEDSSSSIATMNINGTTADIISSHAIATHFTMIPIPEPGVFWILIMGLAVIGVGRLYRKRRAS